MYDKHNGISKGVWLDEKDYDFVNELKDNGFNFSRYVRLNLKALRELDQTTLDELTSFLKVSPDTFLQYACDEKPSKLDLLRVRARDNRIKNSLKVDR